MLIHTLLPSFGYQVHCECVGTVSVHGNGRAVRWVWRRAFYSSSSRARPASGQRPPPPSAAQLERALACQRGQFETEDEGQRRNSPTMKGSARMCWTAVIKQKRKHARNAFVTTQDNMYDSVKEALQVLAMVYDGHLFCGFASIKCENLAMLQSYFIFPLQVLIYRINFCLIKSSRPNQYSFISSQYWNKAFEKTNNQGRDLGEEST